MRSPRAGKQPSFRRDEPDLPSELVDISMSGPPFESGELVFIQGQRLQDLEQRDVRVGNLRVEASVLQSVHLTGGQFGSISWKDARLLNCDLANIRAHRVSLVRVELIDCRLTGFSSEVFECQDVLIRNGDVRYAQLQGGKFRNCEFDRCNCQEADLHNSDLTGSVLRSCNLDRADLHGARLQNTDFRGSEVDGMQVGPGDLRGAIVDPAQAMIFARLLGLQIR